MPKDGLPLIKRILKMLSLEPCEYSRGDAAESLNESLKIVKTKIEKLLSTIENGVDKVKEYCKNLNILIHKYNFHTNIIILYKNIFII